MKLPGVDRAEVDESKIVKYLLSTTHRAGKSKAAFFMDFGFTPDRWQELQTALRQHAQENEVAYQIDTLMIEDLDDVILTCDLPEHRRTRGDIGTVVLIHQGGQGFEVEFTTLDGETLAIVTLMADQVRPCKPREIAHVRDLAANP